MRVLVTGGTGVLGRELVGRLRERPEVTGIRVLSRRPAERPGVVRGDPAYVQGDLESGAGLAAAVEGVDVVAHCASGADYRQPQRDIAQTRRLLDALTGANRTAPAAGPHVVYISIVGIDEIPFGYFRAKLAAERLIAQSGLPWTTLRTTQFHELALMFLMMMMKPPVAVVPRGIRIQPVDTGEVADRLAELVVGPPAGRVPDMGGPRVEDPAAMVRAYLALTGRRRPVLRIPLPGRAARAFRAGHHMVREGIRGTRTFEDFLRSRIGPDRTVTPPYDLRRK